MALGADNDPGFRTIESRHTVEHTIERLQQLLQSHKVVIFAKIDFASDASQAGEALRPETLLIFGNPKSGTPLMQAIPTAGLDLPFKALIWEDADHRAWISYNEPSYIVARHSLRTEAVAIFSPLLQLIALAAQA